MFVFASIQEGGSVRILGDWKLEDPRSELITTDLTGQGSVKNWTAVKGLCAGSVISVYQRRLAVQFLSSAERALKPVQRGAGKLLEAHAQVGRASRQGKSWSPDSVES
jgi:hypothetical protein